MNAKDKEKLKLAGTIVSFAKGDPKLNIKTPGLYGSDPATGRPYTGIKKIDKKYYLFSSGGAMHKAYYKGSKYRHYRSYGKRLRYFYTPDRNGRSAIAYGVKKVSGHYIYFDKNNGYRYKAKKGTSGKWKKIKYGKYYYAVNIKTGYVKTGGTIKLGKTRYKASKKGHLKKKK